MYNLGNYTLLRGPELEIQGAPLPSSPPPDSFPMNQSMPTLLFIERSKNYNHAVLSGAKEECILSHFYQVRQRMKDKDRERKNSHKSQTSLINNPDGDEG